MYASTKSSGDLQIDTVHKEVSGSAHRSKRPSVPDVSADNEHVLKVR